jgi:hypothetical protein
LDVRQYLNQVCMQPFPSKNELEWTSTKNKAYRNALSSPATKIHHFINVKGNVL